MFVFHVVSLANFDLYYFPISDEGIEIPAELPYKDDNLRDASSQDVVGVPNIDQGLANKLRNITTHWRKISAANSANANHLETVFEEKQAGRSDIVNCSVGLCEVINLEDDNQLNAS